MKKILLADDEDILLQDRSRTIKALGFQCITAHNGREAVDLIRTENPDLVLTDVRMPQKNGYDVLDAALHNDPDTPVILFTAFGTIELAVKALKRGAFDYLQKPFTPERLESAIRKALAKRKPEQKARAKNW